MNEDELTAPPADDTIALLVTAARRAGIDVDSAAPDDAMADVRPLRGEWRHVQAMVVVSLAILAVTISSRHTSDGTAALQLTILVLMLGSLVSIYRPWRKRR